MSATLSERVSEAVDHAEEFESRKDVESRVEDEKDKLQSIIDELEEVEDEIQKLIWFQSILEDLFDKELDRADSTLEDLEELVCEELVTSPGEVLEQDLSDIPDECEEVEESVEEEVEELIDSLEGEQENWEEKITDARKVIQIPGLLSDDDKTELEEVSRSIEDFVTTKIWNVRGKGEVSSLKEEWDSLTSTFDDHRTIHGYDNVQEEYGISDDAMEILKELIEDKETELEKIEPDTLEDLKEFDEFVKQVKVSFSS